MIKTSFSRQHLYNAILLIGFALLAAGCGDGGGGDSGGGGGSNPDTFGISGTVTSSNVGLSGVTITLTGGATSTTDANGNYSFTGLANGSYAVTPSKSGNAFSPVSWAISVSGANVTGKNFAATTFGATQYGISGAVTGSVLSGVTVTLTGAGTGTTTTNATGNYSFSGLANGSYTVTPSMSGYTFSPANSAVSVSGADIANKNFVATAAVASGFKDVDLVFANIGHLYGMKADGSGKVLLKAAAKFDAYDYFKDMAFSANGQYMAYAASCAGGSFIRVMGSDLGNPTDLTTTTRCSAGSAGDEGPVYSAYSPAFSPDGTKIAFIGSYNTATEKGNFLSIMNADGTNPHRLSPLAIDPDDGQYYDPDEGSPSFSADGTLIAFSTSRSGGDLATIKLDGTGMQFLGGCTAPGCETPIPFDPTIDWSTNTIYYSSSQPSVLNGNLNIYRISITGSGKVGPLTSSADYWLRRPSVSPDGSKVVFIQDVGVSHTNIMLLDVGTNAVTTISDPAFLTWTSDAVFVRR